MRYEWTSFTFAWQPSLHHGALMQTVTIGTPIHFRCGVDKTIIFAEMRKLDKDCVSIVQN